jgi:DNA-binding SARP family transcriptional activator
MMTVVSDWKNAMVVDNPKFRVLGPLELWFGGRRVDIGAARQRAVLALLLIHANRPVGRDQLIEALWPDRPPVSAAGTLHSLVHRLRTFLSACGVSGEATLDRDSVGYTLHVAPEAVDLYQFEQLAAEGRQALDAEDFQTAVDRLSAALALWRGDAFAEVDVAAVQERAAALSEHRLEVGEWCLAAELGLGNHERVLSKLQTLTARHPYRERLWELLMTALYRSGRQVDALDAYQRLYRLLDDELGIQPSPTVRELHQQILAGAPELETVSAPRSRPDQPAPRMLPTSIRDFTGRAEQVNALDALLPETEEPAPSVVIASITGPGGIGKTILAVHWAHQVADRFPDGQLYVNLRGFDPSRRPVEPTEAARYFLEALGVDPRRIPAGLDAQAAQLRSQLAGRRMLVLLDNATREEQVRPLLPASPGCLVLITSRHRLSGLIAAQAAHSISLDVLNESEAHELLARRLGHDRVAAKPRATQEIIARCGGLPLALAVVAARAAIHPEFPLDALAAKLRGSKTSLEAFSSTDTATDLRAVFSWSYESLEPDSARLFRLLGLHPGPDITAPAAASLAGVPVDRAQTMLGELTDTQLVLEHLPGRYALHDLLRVYASELARLHDAETERHLAIQRILDHYVHSARSAALLLSPQRSPVDVPAAQPGATSERPTDYAQALAWFTAEHPILLAALDLAAASEFDAHTLSLAWALADFLHRQSNWHAMASTWHAALNAANRLGDRSEQARSHRGLARGHIGLGRFDDAHRHLRQALRVFGELDETAGQAHVHNTLCWIFDLQKSYNEALEHAQQAHKLFQIAGHLVGQAAALNNIGWYHAKRSHYRQALTCCRQALDMYQELGDSDGKGAAWDSIGYALHHLGHNQFAIACYHRAYHLHREAGERQAQAETLDRLGDTQHAVGDHPAARHNWRRALDLLDELHHPDAEPVRAKLSGKGQRST